MPWPASGPAWCQAKLHRAGLVESPLCLGCEAAPGTLFHRWFQCPATRERRGEILSPLVACSAEAVDPIDQEKVARCHLPDLSFWLPQPLCSSSCEVRWVNRPASGLLSGDLFVDGSSWFGEFPFLRRAGWAIVQVDRHGNLQAAVYGPAPADLCLRQSSGEAEVYSLCMCSLY